MRRDVSANSLRLDRNILSIFCCFLIIITMWLGVYLNNNSVALIGSTEEGVAVAFNRAIASQPTVMDNLKNQVKSDLEEESDSVEGKPGFANSVIEKVRAVTGQQKRSFGDSGMGIEAVGDLMDERTEENVANIQGKARNSGCEFEGAVKGTIEQR